MAKQIIEKWLAIIAFGVSLMLASPAMAQQSAMRMVDIGTHAFVQTGPAEWTQVDKSTWQPGPVFQEVARDLNGVQVHDASRQMFLAFNLPANTVYISQNGGAYQPQWTIVSVAGVSVIPGSNQVWDQSASAAAVPAPTSPNVSTSNPTQTAAEQLLAQSQQQIAQVPLASLQGVCSVVVMERLLPYKTSSGTDSDVNEAIFGMMSDYYSAIGDGASEAAGAMPDPKAGAALAVAGMGAKGFSAVLSKLPQVIGAIDTARDDADDLYMSFSNERGHEASFFPSLGEYTDRFTPGLDASLKGISGRVVPYIFGVDETEDRIAVNFYDHDSDSRDDSLGQAIFFRNETGTGRHATLMLSEKHGGVVYLIEYEIVPITCQPAMQPLLRQMYQGAGFTVLDNAMIATSLGNAYLSMVKSELADKGIVF